MVYITQRIVRIEINENRDVLEVYIDQIKQDMSQNACKVLKRYFLD